MALQTSGWMDGWMDGWLTASDGGGGMWWRWRKQSSSGVSDSTCAYSIADEIYCGTKLQELCTMFLLGFDGVVCCLGSMLIILVCTVRSYPPMCLVQCTLLDVPLPLSFLISLGLDHLVCRMCVVCVPCGGCRSGTPTSSEKR